MVIHRQNLPKTIKNILASCEVHNINSPLTHPQAPKGVQRQGRYPGEAWQLDFTHTPKARGYKYLLVWVGTVIHWVEAFPWRTEKATEVPKALITEIITRLGLPPVPPE